jgi:hypothetical protein
MKKIIPFICTIAFLVGIAIILTADTGIITNYESAHIAGAIISIFSGTYLGIYLFHFLKTK